MTRVLFPLVLASMLLLAACSAVAEPVSIVAPPVSTPTQPPTPPATPETVGSARIDEQGAVIVEVAPLNLDSAVGDLEFDVSLNTHSIDLSMDLATLATLKTDTGITVPAMLWDAPRGGHHVSGRLFFPAWKGGLPVLEGASRITIAILDLDAPLRVFEWTVK